MVKEYAVGFVFTPDLEKVLLIHKNRPAWQAGKINGIGGKREPGETPVQCIARETQEETGLIIPETAWILLGSMLSDLAQVHFFGTIFGGYPDGAQTQTDEEIEWIMSQELPKACIPNLRWIIPFALEKLEKPSESYTLGEFLVHYLTDPSTEQTV